MEFLRTINLARKTMPFPFYMLLVAVPVAVFLILFLAARTLATEDSFVNVHTISLFAFLGYINFCFWKKLHWQRLDDFEKAASWINNVDRMGLVIFIAIMATW